VSAHLSGIQDRIHIEGLTFDAQSGQNHPPKVTRRNKAESLYSRVTLRVGNVYNPTSEDFEHNYVTTERCSLSVGERTVCLSLQHGLKANASGPGDRQILQSAVTLL
jgi:hypothetical protein